MRIRRTTWCSFLPAVAVCFACAGEVVNGSADLVPATVTLQRVSGGPLAQAAPQLLADVVGASGSIDLASVDSIMVTLERVEFLKAPVEGDATQGNGWLSLPVDNARLNLLALPASADAAVVVATGDLPAGDYVNVRLFVTDVTAWFNTALTVGPFSFDPDAGYTVTIPSGAQTGIKTDQGFSLADGNTTVSLGFDAGATLANVTATGNGRVIVAPVIRMAGAPAQ